MAKAVVLLSGGLDSTTTMAVAKVRGFEVYALSVDYGQRHRVELVQADQVAKSMGVVEHRTVRLDLRTIGGSALTSSIDVPKGRSTDDMNHGIPITYVPARNTLLLGLALGFAETIGAFDLFIGGWEGRDAQRRGIPPLLVVPALVLTVFLGPSGLLLYLALRKFKGAELLNDTVSTI